MGLSDKVQAGVVLVSTLLIAVGSASTAAGIDPRVGVGMAVVGAVGMALKEAAGTKQGSK